MVDEPNDDSSDPKPAEKPTAELVREAVAAATGDLRADFDRQKADIEANRDAIIAEKRAETKKRQGLEKELGGLRLKAKATEDGHDPEDFAKAVETAAGEKFAALETEWLGTSKAKDTRISELETSLKASDEAKHSAAVAAELVEAALGDRRVWHDGYGQDVVGKLAPFMHPMEVDGREVFGFKTQAGTWINSLKNPGKLMMAEEYLGLQKAGKRVEGLPAIGVYLIDKGAGADVKEASGPVAGKTWIQMTEGEKMDEHEKNPDNAQRLIAADAVKKAQETLQGVAA